MFKRIHVTDRVQVHLEYEPRGATETVAASFGLADRQMRKGLERFKELVEARSRAA